MIQKRGRSVLFFLILLVIPLAWAEDVKITFQPNQQLYHVEDTVVVDVFLESNRPAPTDFPITTFQLFVEHNGGSMFDFISPIMNDNQNNFFNKVLQNNELLSVSRWSMGDTVTEMPVTLSTSLVRIGSLRGTATSSGIFSLSVPTTDAGIYFRTGTGPGRVTYTYESTSFPINILNAGEECLANTHCTSYTGRGICDTATNMCVQCTVDGGGCGEGQTCVLNQCQTSGDFSISIPVDANGFILPQYACSPAGTPTSYGISPPITISNPPPRTAGYVLIMDDLDSTPTGAVHWIMWTDDSSITENWVGGQGQNDIFSNSNYVGPCPDVGDEAHRYRFRLYAIDNTVEDVFDNFYATSTKADVLHYMGEISDTRLDGAEGNVLDVAVVEGQFRFSCMNSGQCGWVAVSSSCNTVTGLCETPAESVCGDGSIDEGETCASCPADVACIAGDDDNDSVSNPNDLCSGTPAGKSVYPTGSPNAGCQLGDINANGCIDLPDWNLFLSLISNYFENTGYIGPGDLTSANGLDLGDWNMFLGAMGQDFTTC